MKIVCIGDLEGRTIWKDIIKKENPDLTIFLGDYVASRVVSPKQEVSTLEELMEYKEANPDKVILLRGNHDLEALGYSWAACYPQAPDISKKFIQAHKERFLNNTQWIYVDEDLKTIFSHAGISQIWINETVEPYLVEGNVGSQYDDGSIDTEIVLKYINTIEPCKVFGFIGDRFDMCGDSKTQSCVWIRPETLMNCAIPDWKQIVGHTRTKKIGPVPSDVSNLENPPEIWLCDSLGWRNYLVIEDGEFKPKGLL